MEIVNKPYAKAFEDFAKDKEEILCISADLDSSCEIDGFRDRYHINLFLWVWLNKI